jgi:hypothetical protein
MCVRHIEVQLLSVSLLDFLLDPMPCEVRPLLYRRAKCIGSLAFVLLKGGFFDSYPMSTLSIIFTTVFQVITLFVIVARLRN